MKILREGNARVAAIIGKKLKADKLYRLSCYTFPYSEGEELLIRSTLTGMTVALSGDERACVEKARDLLVSGAELKSAGLEELARNCFFAEEGTDEYRLYELARSALKAMSREKKGTKSFTILPTTGCNARCVYCYEEGIPVQTMTDETADQVVDFIARTRWDDTVKLRWFGGEPLAGARIISRICRTLTEKGIPYRSEMITNATLMTPELLDEAVDLWHLEKAQVSVDGKREDYEARKRYVNPGKHHYDAMMRAVRGMLDKGIQVVIRCNYDWKNFDGIKEFFDEVKACFGSAEKLSVYLAMVYQERDKESCVELKRKALMLNDYLRKIGLNKTGGSRNPLKVNGCMADSEDKSMVIAPDGTLYHCEHMPENTSLGSIFDSDITVYNDDRGSESAREECRRCVFLPMCTPFYRNGCPNWFSLCREFIRVDTEEAMRLFAKNVREEEEDCFDC